MRESAGGVFRKTLKVEDADLMEHETFEDIAAGTTRFIDACKARLGRSALGHLSFVRFQNRIARGPVEAAA